MESSEMYKGSMDSLSHNICKVQMFKRSAELPTLKSHVGHLVREKDGPAREGNLRKINF